MNRSNLSAIQVRLRVAHLFCFILLAEAALFAQQVTVELDPARTTVAYSVESTLHTVHGTFKTKSGKFSLDPSTGSASGVVVIDVISGESGNGSRDSRMHKEILESAKYPEATFTAQHVTGKLASTGDSHLQVSGIFRLHGADHPLTLAMQVNIAAGEAQGKTEFEVPYVEWGIKNPSNFLLKVNKVAKVEVQTTGRVQIAQP